MDYSTLWEYVNPRATNSPEAAAHQPPCLPQRVGQFSEGAAVPAREQMMKRASDQARSNAAVALWRISRNAPLVVPVLVEALQVKSTNYADTRPAFFAANILAEIGPEAKVSVPVLSSMLGPKTAYCCCRCFGAD